jgi:hypothetical protein
MPLTFHFSSADKYTHTLGSFEGGLALKFVLIKNYNLPLPRPKKDVQVTKEAFSSQENIQHFKA